MIFSYPDFRPTAMPRPLTFLCITTYEKGQEFMCECKRESCRVILLTAEKLRNADWPRESLDDTFYLPEELPIHDIVQAVSHLARGQKIDRIVALDEFDMETAATLREHLRIPGMGLTTMRYFRDKLAMRMRALDRHVRVPDFVPIVNHDDIRYYMDHVPGPWVLKPRQEASAIGIKKINSPEELWPLLDQLGDKQSGHLLEKFLPGDVFHVDSVVSENAILFSNVSKYGKPPMTVAHGGVFTTFTVPRESEEDAALRKINEENVTVQANFLGMGADNATSVPNQGNGLLVGGTSLNTQVGGVIPLGNVISGNTLNGIQVQDQASGFVSFNTFGGIAAFQTFASPNGLDGILITSTGGNNTVRTCIISGNNQNGIEIAGNASGVQITETSVGTNSNISGGIPNLGSGIVIRGEAHNNAIGGFQPSVEPQNFVSGNRKYGIAVMDRASNNSIFHTAIGRGAALTPPYPVIPNLSGGILLGPGTSGTTIGGPAIPLQTVMQNNFGPGLYINGSTKNLVSNNSITFNSAVGIFAVGVCTGTVLKGNSVLNNGAGGTVNVNTASATGVTVTP